MSERLAEITVSREIRDKIKELKGKMTYTDFLKRLINPSQNYFHN